MFRNAKFELARRIQEYEINGNRFEDNLICKILETWSPEGDNTKVCRSIDVRLADKLQRNKWRVQLSYKHPQLRTPAVVSIKGKILKELQSLMSYNVNQVKLNVKLNVQFWSRGPFKVELALSPSVKDGVYDHSCYIYDSPNMGIPHTQGINLLSVSSVSIRIEGLGHPPDLKILMRNPCAKHMGKFRYQGDTESDIVILYKIGNNDENDRQIRANANVLCAQSPVIKDMLRKSKCKKGSAKEVPMTERSKREVIAFLDYLYYGLGEETLEDSILSSVLYEMAHYYEVQEMEQALEYFFLGQAPEYFEAEAALRLFKAANDTRNKDLRQLAVDVLKLPTDEQLQSETVSGIFKTDTGGISELFRLYCKI